MRKVIIFLAVLVAATANQQLRIHDMEHDLSLPFIGELGPMETLKLMSGDYASLLPESIQPFARKILGQEQQSGPAGFLNNMSNMMGGGSSSSGGMFGGLGDMFGGGNKQSGSPMSNIMSAFGGSSGQSSKGGILSSLGLPF